MTHDIDQLHTLLERLEQADGSDRETDADIHCIFSEENFITHPTFPRGM